MRLTVIGLGLIGGSIAKDLRRLGFSKDIIGVDIDKNNCKKAIELGLVDSVSPLETAIKGRDLVIIAIPVDATIRLLPTVLDNIDINTTVTDMGSTKRGICSVVDSHDKRGNFVASHPMSGTENSGPEAALDNLFRDKMAIICDQERSFPQHIAIVEKMYQTIGMSIAYMSSDDQDHSTAFVSHFPHATSFALANTVLKISDRQIIFDLASGGFNSTVRLAKSSYKMWGPIFEQNSDYIVESLDEYIEQISILRDAIKSKNSDKINTLIANANKIREILENQSPSLVKSEEMYTKFYKEN